MTQSTRALIVPTSVARPKRCAIYTRVSTWKQEETGTSLESQLDHCRRHAAALGYVVAPEHVFRDTASGAVWRERPALQRVLAAVRAGEIDVVLSFALDRLSRDQQHVAVIVDMIEDAGARLELVTEDFEQTAIGRFLRSAKAFVAEIEREKIEERTLRGKLTRVRSGKVHNHSAELYGYRRDKARGVRVVYEAEAEIVRRIFSWAAEGVPLRSIMRRLNETGVPTPSDSKRGGGAEGRTRWGHGVLYRVLTNPAYKGEAVAWRYRRTGNGKVELRPEAEWIPLPAEATPAVVSPALWTAVQDRLRRNVGDATRNNHRAYLLRGLVFCSVCGRRMYASPERGHRTYRCSSRDSAAGPCGGKRVPADAAEQWVWSEVAARLRDPDLVAREVAGMRASGPDPALLAERASIEGQLQRVERRQKRLVARLREIDDEDFPWKVYEEEVASAEREKLQHRAKLAETDHKIAAQEARVVQLESLADYCATVAANLDAFEFDDKRLALEAMEARVEANGREWTVAFSLPGKDRPAGEMNRTWS